MTYRFEATGSPALPPPLLLPSDLPERRLAQRARSSSDSCTDVDRWASSLSARSPHCVNRTAPRATASAASSNRADSPSNTSTRPSGVPHRRSARAHQRPAFPRSPNPYPTAHPAPPAWSPRAPPPARARTTHHPPDLDADPPHPGRRRAFPAREPRRLHAIQNFSCTREPVPPARARWVHAGAANPRAAPTNPRGAKTMNSKLTR